MIDHQPTTCQKFYRQQGARRPGDIISYRRATSSRNQRATSSESAHCRITGYSRSSGSSGNSGNSGNSGSSGGSDSSGGLGLVEDRRWENLENLGNWETV